MLDAHVAAYGRVVVEHLAAGGTQDPVGHAKIAGVDVTTDGPLNATIDYIGKIIDEICRLTEELDGI